jgi:hypothetical protein
MVGAPLRLFNTLGRELQNFVPLEPAKVRVYTCGPTVYVYQHIGNLRAYVCADTLRRVLEWKCYEVAHVVNITDVGHLTSDMDEGEDKLGEGAGLREACPARPGGARRGGRASLPLQASAIRPTSRSGALPRKTPSASWSGTHPGERARPVGISSAR